MGAPEGRADTRVCPYHRGYRVDGVYSWRVFIVKKGRHMGLPLLCRLCVLIVKVNDGADAPIKVWQIKTFVGRVNFIVG